MMGDAAESIHRWTCRLRIGRTVMKPVLIFRLVSRHTIESKIMQHASEKRQLEALVIAKGVCPTVRPAPFFCASWRACVLTRKSEF